MTSENIKNKKRHGREKDTINDFESICEYYPKLKVSDIEFFAPVYYPIATLEMKLVEETFENLEAIQSVILNLINIGIKDHILIADTLGLSPTYVSKIIRILYGYGHINQDGTTELGKRSVGAGKKITVAKVWQKFHVDALNGTLIRIDNSLVNNTLNHKAATNAYIGHLNYLDAISKRNLQNDLIKQDISDFKTYDQGILNSNVTDIEEIRFIDIQYAESYLLRIKNVMEPIVMAKRYNSKAGSFQERFTWHPFSVVDKSILTKFGITTRTPTTSIAARIYINNLYQAIIDNQREEQIIKSIITSINWMYPFELTVENCNYYINDSKFMVTVTLDQFKVYRPWILRLLKSLGCHGEYTIVGERLFGMLASVVTESELIMETARVFNEKLKNTKYSILSEYLNEKIEQTFDCENGFKRMLGLLINYNPDNID